jgi:hypothetical protein
MLMAAAAGSPPELVQAPPTPAAVVEVEVPSVQAKTKSHIAAKLAARV